MDMSFWGRNPLAGSAQQSQSAISEKSDSYLMSVIAIFESALEQALSMAAWPVSSLKATLAASPEDGTLLSSSTLLLALLGLLACLALAMVVNYSRSLKRILLTEEEDDDEFLDDFEEDEEDDEEEDDDDYRGRGDRPSKKTHRSRYSSDSARRRQRRRR